MSCYSDITVIFGFEIEQRTGDVHFLMVWILISSYIYKKNLKWAVMVEAELINSAQHCLTLHTQSFSCWLAHNAVQSFGMWYPFHPALCCWISGINNIEQFFIHRLFLRNAKLALTRRDSCTDNHWRRTYQAS